MSVSLLSCDCQVMKRWMLSCGSLIKKHCRSMSSTAVSILTVDSSTNRGSEFFIVRLLVISKFLSLSVSLALSFSHSLPPPSLPLSFAFSLSRARDFYHTCYCLSGLSVAQHCYGNKNIVNITLDSDSVLVSSFLRIISTVS